MKQYLDLLQNILTNGVEKESGRANMPNTIGLSDGTIKVDIQDGKNFPLLTTKKMFLRGIIEELLWMLAGDTNIKRLVDKNVDIWNGDAYRWYLDTCNGRGAAKPDNDGLIRVIPIQYGTIESFVDAIKNDETSEQTLPLTYMYGYKLGDLGKVYGYQWRNQNGIDQIKEIIDGLKTNPYGRYHILDTWNKADFKEMALPPCHLLYQFIVRPLNLQERLDWYIENVEPEIWEDLEEDDEYIEYFDKHNVPKFYLDLNMYQRSCDTLLGVPFNVASMSILLMIMAKVSNMVAGRIKWMGGDTHLYVNHVPFAQEQIKRTPYPLPTLKINKELHTLEDILELKYEDFELINYVSHPAIKAELFTGYKK